MRGGSGHSPSLETAGSRSAGASEPAVGTTRVSSAELFASHHDKIRRYILSIVRDPVEADDLTQDVFLQVHRKLDTVRDPDALVSWLYRIATHICYDRFRASKRRPATESLDAGGPIEAMPQEDVGDQPRLGHVIEQAEMSACVRKYIEDLSTEYRQAILLHDLEGLSNPDIAEMLGASLDAVKIRLHRARRKLQIALAKHCDLSLDEQGVLVCEPADLSSDEAGRPAGGVSPAPAESS
jgi:RNA polymerase sigma-70 factor (ECF subfamily)